MTPTENRPVLAATNQKVLGENTEWNRKKPFKPISDVVFEFKGKHIYIYLAEKECTIGTLKPFLHPPQKKPHIHKTEQRAYLFSVVAFWSPTARKLN